MESKPTKLQMAKEVEKLINAAGDMSVAMDLDPPIKTDYLFDLKNKTVTVAHLQNVITNLQADIKRDAPLIEPGDKFDPETHGVLADLKVKVPRPVIEKVVEDEDKEELEPTASPDADEEEMPKFDYSKCVTEVICKDALIIEPAQILLKLKPEITLWEIAKYLESDSEGKIKKDNAYQLLSRRFSKKPEPTIDNSEKPEPAKIESTADNITETEYTINNSETAESEPTIDNSEALEQANYNKLLDKVVSILPEEPPLNWEPKTFKQASKKVKIIIGRLNPFIVV